MERLQTIHLSQKDTILNLFCRFVRRHKGHKVTQKLSEFKTAKLDICSIIDNSIALNDFFRCFLSRK